MVIFTWYVVELRKVVKVAWQLDFTSMMRWIIQEQLFMSVAARNVVLCVVVAATDG